MCVGVVSCSDGAYLPRVSAPPAPAKLWHMAQLTRKISPPSAMALLFSAEPGSMTVVYFESGMAGPEPSEATYAARALICSGENFTLLTGAWTFGPASGMRPVPTWKSTEAAPTPTSEGPDFVPWALRPWQLAQLARKRSLPSATVSAVTDAAALASLGARKE